MPQIPDLPGTHRQIDGGLATTRLGRTLAQAPDTERVWVWDQITGEQVLDLYDYDGSSVATLSIVGGTFRGGVPTATEQAEFSVGRNGPRLPGNDWAQVRQAGDARDAAQAAAAQAIAAAGQALPIVDNGDGTLTSSTPDSPVVDNGDGTLTYSAI